VSNPEVRVKVIGFVVLDDKVWWRATIRIDAPQHLVYLFAYHQYVGLLRPMQFAGIPPAPTFRAIIEAAIRLEVERAWEELRNVTFAMEDPGPHIPGDEDDPEMAPDVPCTGCYDHSCPTCGCPKEKFTTPRQRAEENLKAGNIFDVPEDEWEREAAGYRAILAAEDAK
jgi:hypothetical protein